MRRYLVTSWFKLFLARYAKTNPIEPNPNPRSSTKNREMFQNVPSPRGVPKGVARG